MSWQKGVAITVVLLGLGAGAFLVAQRPSFWFEFGLRLSKTLLPLAWLYVSTRMPPEEEAAWRQADPPPLKWSDLKYVLWHQGGSKHAKEEAHA